MSSKLVPPAQKASNQSSLNKSASNQNAPNIVIVGAGAIGMLIYHQLTHATSLNNTPSKPTKPLLLGRNFCLSTTDIQTQSLTVETFSDDSLINDTIVQPCLVNNLSAVTSEQLSNIELVIMCVKSYQVNDAVAALIDKLPSKVTLLLLHNGLGPHLQVIKLIETHQRDDICLYLGTTSQAALKVGQLHVRQTGTGKTVIGKIRGAAISQQLESILLSTIPNSETHSNILLGLWQKLIVNCAINPLTAIEQCNNGQLAQAQYQDRINAIATECIEVAKAEGVQLSLTESLSTIYNVIQLTANNFSSMYQDVKHQRTTEIKQINGFVTARAQQHGISTPVNEALAEKINQLTEDIAL
ncbi:ketopantoate reductase family protein [Shewanella goraebulensis]|uniref:ketopantoate reductase family protein n=1 Tax=Shewanella goraebulensis TaxID=3050637 RepID=UPI00254D3EF9|nr:2-dehydropantoate 2-reductase [Shewanella goraebulensis]